MSESWHRVDRETWKAFIQLFPDRVSYKTGICEPPMELCESPKGRVVASVTFGDWDQTTNKPLWDVKVYRINEAARP